MAKTRKKKFPNWLVTDKEGLKALNADKPKSFVVRELVQNAFDESGVTFVEVTLTPVPRTAKVVLMVEDDAPEGFYDLRHAYTLFADTRKRVDPEMRGQFNLGEKQVLSLCDEAVISTTTGTVTFNKDGTREEDPSSTRSAGSVFSATLPMTRAELQEVEETIRTFLPPKGVVLRFNQEPIEYREPEHVIEATLQTVYADKEGVMRRTTRKTKVEILDPEDDDVPTLYEMGLPVCETGDKYHYNVLQRVPLSTDRDTVSEAFMQDLRAEVLNEVVDELDEEECAEAWVQEAIQDERVHGAAVSHVVTKQHGTRAFVPTPGDPEATERAIDAGYHVVSANAYSKAAWANIRDKTAALPAATVVGGATQVVSGKVVPFEEWADSMKRVARLAKYIAKQCLGISIEVRYFKAKKVTALAQYGARTISFNRSHLSAKFFVPVASEEQIDLIVHELGHEYGGHYDMVYHEALTKMAAKLARIDPEKLERVADGTGQFLSSLGDAVRKHAEA